MRTDLLASIHTHTERVFCDLLASGELSFRLEGNGLSWELAEKLAFEVMQPPDYPLSHKANGQPVEKTLFEQIWSRHFNGLEKDVALYIDDVKAVRWWHRIAVQADWYLDGWKKKRVFPDFLVALEEKDGKADRLVVVETKGLHLQNDDTAYKKKLFEVLEKHSSSGVPVGELTLDTQPEPMRFRLVFEGDWKSQVDAAFALERHRIEAGDLAQPLFEVTEYALIPLRLRRGCKRMDAIEFGPRQARTRPSCWILRTPPTTSGKASSPFTTA